MFKCSLQVMHERPMCLEHIHFTILVCSNHVDKRGNNFVFTSFIERVCVYQTCTTHFHLNGRFVARLE